MIERRVLHAYIAAQQLGSGVEGENNATSSLIMINNNATHPETPEEESNIYEWMKEIIKRHKRLVIGLVLFWSCWPAVIWLLHCFRNFILRFSGPFFNTHYAVDKYGQFGDMYGVFNALISGLALLGVLYACYLQRAEIKDERKWKKEKETFDNCEKMFRVIQQCRTERFLKATESKNSEQIMVELAYKLAKCKKDRGEIDIQDAEVNPLFEEWWKIRESVVSPSFAFLKIHSILNDVDEHDIQKIYYLQELDLLDERYIQAIIVALILHKEDIFKEGWGGYYMFTSGAKTFEEYLGNVIKKSQYLHLPNKHGIKLHEASLAFRELLEQFSKG